MRKDEKDECLNYLQSLGLLEYGAFIRREVFEKMLESKYDSGWEFLSDFLEIKQYLEENGYLCTTHDLPHGSLRIYDIDEMAERSTKVNNNLFKRLIKLNKCMECKKLIGLLWILTCVRPVKLVR